MEDITLLILVSTGVISIIFFGWAIGLYNSLVQLKNNVTKSLANIDVLLKQRTDELPNLVETVKGYVKHEQETLNKITRLRVVMMQANNPEEKAATNEALTETLKSLFAISENYPDLKANKNFLALQQRISGLENEIADRREFYNDSVNTYNTRIQEFPALLLANMLKYEQKLFFTATNKEKARVEIQL